MDNINPQHIIINGKGTGAIRDLPDPRDYPYALRLLDSDMEKVAEAPMIPDYRDLRRQFSGVYDQGQLGSCTAQAVAGAVEFLQWRQGHYRVTPSRLALYYAARYLLDPSLVGEDSGATLRTAIKALVDYGASPETLWPYEIRNFAVNPPPPVWESALQRQGLEYFRLSDGSITQMVTCLAAGFPFVFGISVAENFRPKRGSIPMPEGDWLGGHAMLAVGYSNRSKRILVRNSWDETWGIHGYAWLPYGYMEQAWDLWTLRAIENPEA